VKVKSFISSSPGKDLENDIGAIHFCEDIIAKVSPRRILDLTVREEVYLTFFSKLTPEIRLYKGYAVM
jgi:hypothetical protein